MGQYIPNVEELHRHAAGECDISFIFYFLMISIYQAIDSFLKSPHCQEIEHLRLFDQEWMVLLDLAHILSVGHYIIHICQW